VCRRWRREDWLRCKAEDPFSLSGIRPQATDQSESCPCAGGVSARQDVRRWRRRLDCKRFGALRSARDGWWSNQGGEAMARPLHHPAMTTRSRAPSLPQEYTLTLSVPGGMLSTIYPAETLANATDRYPEAITPHFVLCALCARPGTGGDLLLDAAGLE
jgi:hypothetical protein